jgi:colicin import membrane protein
MKQILIALLMAMPMLASAQDNTWERTELEPVSKQNKDAKYLVENAVPVIDGKVCWKTTIQAPGKSAQQIYDILLAHMEMMTQ